MDVAFLCDVHARYTLARPFFAASAGSSSSAHAPADPLPAPALFGVDAGARAGGIRSVQALEWPPTTVLASVRLLHELAGFRLGRLGIVRHGFAPHLLLHGLHAKQHMYVSRWVCM